MSEKIKVACVQFECGNSALTDAELVNRNIEKAGELTRKAAKEGARIILLSELFERQYFCQERRYDYYEYATEILENPAVKFFSGLCRELEVVMPISIYEKDGNELYNSVVMIDADGKLLGIYRKNHIPDDHYYQE
ncbi:MAG: N-carbamoylputrescine amidase, partial [Butyrivibrio sp.]|nr:N-carbamoylputrescine amidase [Butyrivibrio sp.]